MSDTRILFWNAQGLNNKRLELLQFTQNKKVDILLINETHLANKKHFTLPNYFTYASNKPSVNGRPPAGGTAILIHRRFIHQVEAIQTRSITNTSILVNLGNTKTRLVAVYKRPSET